MIGKLKGQVDSVSGNSAVIDVQGVGYEVYCTRACIASFRVGSLAEVVVFTELKQDHIRLYGFEDRHEKEVFMLLMQVKGIGPKSAADLVSKIDKHELVRLIGRGELTKLQAVKGVGKKTAERIIVELKDRIGDYIIERRQQGAIELEVEKSPPSEDALQALLALGFPRREAEKAVNQVQALPNFSSLASGEIVREALRFV